MKNIGKKLLWFTLIEVLIAIIILATSAVLILWIINNTQRLRATAYTKTIATLLSKEWVEIFLNNRNSNIMDNGRDLPWDCIAVDSEDGDCDNFIEIGNQYTINTNNAWWYSIQPDGDQNIYICDGIYTQENNNCKITEFKRYITFEKYNESDQAYVVKSTVVYDKNWYTWSVTLQGILWNIWYIKKKS